MPFTPPPSKGFQVEVTIESTGEEHSVVILHALNHPKTVSLRARLSVIGWKIKERVPTIGQETSFRLTDSYSVSLDGVSLEAVKTLYKEVRSEYGLPEFRVRVC